MDKDLLLQSYEPLKEMVTKIYAGENILDDAYKYVYFTPKETNSTVTKVIDESKPPIIRSFVKTIPEDSFGGSVVGTIEILRGSEDVTFGTLSGPGNEEFEINSEGEIRLKDDATLDYETKWLYKLKVEALNKNGSSGQVGVYISIKNILDAPEYVMFEGGEVAENAIAGAVVGRLTFEDGAAPITSIEMQGESVDKFNIDTQGLITLADGATLDYETKYSYGFVVIAKNSYGSSMPVILYINVQDIEDSPSIIGYSGGYVHENASSGAVVGQVVYNKGGADIESATIEGAGSENFTIDLNGTIRVSSSASLDYESQVLYQPLVTINNIYGSSNKRIFISVVDTLDVPSLVSFSGGNVKENARIGTVVGQLTFETGSTPIESIALVGDSSKNFSILNNGTILVAKDVLNYEEQNQYLLQIVATNGFGSSQVVSAYIFIDDIVEKPAVLEDFVVNDLEENAPVGTVIGTLSMLDVGSSSISEFIISGNYSNYFSVDLQGAVRTTRLLDYEKVNEYDLKVKAKNEAGFGNEVNLIVRLKDVADVVPQLSHYSSFSIDENATTVGQINIDSSGDTPITQIILSGEGSELFDVNLTGFISVKQDALLDYDRGIKNYYLRIKAINSAGESRTISEYINVLNVNDIPEVDSVSIQVDEGSTTVAQLNIKAGASPITKFVLEGGNSDFFNIDLAGLITIKDGKLLDYDRGIRYFSLLAQATNALGISLPSSIKISVNNVRDIPVINPFSIAVDENSKVVGTLKFDEGNSSITEFTLTGNDSKYFNIDLNATVRVNNDYTIDYDRGIRRFNLSVQATNEAGKSLFSYINIYVKNVHDIPEVNPFSTTIDENAKAGSVIGKLSINEGESPLEDIQLYNANDNTGYGNDFFSVDLDGNLRLTKTVYNEEHDYSRLYVIAKNSAGDSIEKSILVRINDNQDDIYSRDNQVILVGPLNGATIELLDMNNSKILFTGITSESTSLRRAGVFNFPNSLTDNLSDNQHYILKTTGGYDVDLEALEAISKELVPYFVSLHAIVSGNKLKNENFKVNILTEVAYQVLKETLNEELNTTELADSLDEVATRLLIEDVDGNDEINYDDILAWNPLQDKEKLLKPYEKYYQPIVEKIYNDENIHTEAYDLVYEPFFRDVTLHVDENATVGTIVGKVKLDLFDGVVAGKVKSALSHGVINYYLDEYSKAFDFSLDGKTLLNSIAKGSSVFDVSLDGNISLGSAGLDYEDVSSYRLYVTAEVDGEYYSTEVRIIVNNLLELPILQYLSVQINKNAPPLSSIGNIRIISSDGISKIVLEGEGSELFDVDELGNISVAKGASFNYDVKSDYALKAYAVNQLGESEKVSVNIQFPSVKSLNTPDYQLNRSSSADGVKEFVANGDSGLRINIVARRFRTTLGSVDTPGYAYRVSLSANETKAFVADSDSGLQIIDVSDPTAPFIIGSLGTPGYAYEVILSTDGTKAFVADGHSGLQIVDVSDPTAPFVIGSVDTPGYAYGIILSADGTRAFVADSYSGLQIVDVSDPKAPIIIDSVDTPGIAYK